MSRILVVDDEPDERFLLRRMFERDGHEVLDAADGAAALAIVRESAPDLIVTDMMMPVMDGPELIRRLRSDPATAGIPIMASTGDPGLASSADVVVSKSLSLQDLAAAVSACLKEGRDPLNLMSTGIGGLDLVLNGGLERGSVVVLAGAPVDSTKMLRDFADERQLRSALYSLTSRVAHTDTVLLLVGEYTPQELASGIEFSLADGILHLEYEPREPVDRRSLRVSKVRGSSQRPGKHTFQIGPAGIEVFPRIETLVPDTIEAAPGRSATGIPGLDQLMDGGPKATDATLVTGPSGVGKTIFGLRWTAEALEQGQQCLFVTFQDTPKQLTNMAGTFGWDIGAAQATGRLAISYVPWATSTWTSSRAPSARNSPGTRSAA
ncbi:MAG: ATPase domain-containing protein [Streptosporangiaceae bacterium]